MMFVSAGTMKLFGYPPSPTPMSPIQLMSELGIAGLLEVVGGLAIVLGLLTRPVAFVLSGEMAVAYFKAHFPQSFFPTVNNGVPVCWGPERSHRQVSRYRPDASRGPR